MFRRYRQRRGPYAMAAPSVVPSIIRSIILLALVLLILYVAGRWIIGLFGGAGAQQSYVTMEVERGTVNYSLEGGLMQRAEGTSRLFPDDRVTTGGNGNALLTFFDGSVARIDVQSDVTIEGSRQAEESETSLVLAGGALWMRTPTVEGFSGAITRTVDLPRYSATIPSDAEVVIEENGVLVFSADGQGVALSIDGVSDTLYIGEGQQYVLPDDNEITGDPYRYRSAIEPLAVQRDFIEESRTIKIGTVATGTGTTTGEDMLTVTQPADKTAVTTATVRVAGEVAKRVERVRVNGSDAVIDRSDDTFTMELALTEGSNTLTIDALDARGVVLEKETRTVTRGAQGIASPTITSPAKNGETYRTSQTEFAITGTVPAGAAGVMVNDYKLQLFRAGDTTWSYLASTALNNMKSGTNVYDVYTLDAAGNKSAPARITILLEAGAQGVVGGGAAASSQPAVNEATLPKNDPLQPGTLSVTGPTPGRTHTATGSEFLLEGTTPSGTATVWVNGYRLQLFKTAGTYWNYIARTDYGTLKPGTNVYRIVARNADNQILDQFEYTVTYNP
jgi:hypothetical protein